MDTNDKLTKEQDNEAKHYKIRMLKEQIALKKAQVSQGTDSLDEEISRLEKELNSLNESKPKMWLHG